MQSDAGSRWPVEARRIARLAGWRAGGLGEEEVVVVVVVVVVVLEVVVAEVVQEFQPSEATGPAAARPARAATATNDFILIDWVFGLMFSLNE